MGCCLPKPAPHGGSRRGRSPVAHARVHTPVGSAAPLPGSEVDSGNELLRPLLAEPAPDPADPGVTGGSLMGLDRGTAVVAHSLSAVHINGRYGVVNGMQGERLLVDFGATGVKALRRRNVRRLLAWCHECRVTSPPRVEPRSADDAEDAMRCGECGGGFVEEARRRHSSQAPPSDAAWLWYNQLLNAAVPGHAFPSSRSLQPEEELLRRVQLLQQLMAAHGLYGLGLDGGDQSAPRPAQPVASPEAVAALPRICVDAAVAKECGECAICQDEPSEGEEVVRLPCGHLFHSACVLPWLGRTYTCPTCRHELPLDDGGGGDSAEQRSHHAGEL